MPSSCTRCSRSRVPWPVAPGRPAAATGTSSQARPWSCAHQLTTRPTIAQSDVRPCPSRHAGTVLTTVRSCQPSGRAPLTDRSATAGPQVSGPTRARSRTLCMSPGPLHRTESVTRCAGGVPTSRGRTRSRQHCFVPWRYPGSNQWRFPRQASRTPQVTWTPPESHDPPPTDVLGVSRRCRRRPGPGPGPPDVLRRRWSTSARRGGSALSVREMTIWTHGGRTMPAVVARSRTGEGPETLEVRGLLMWWAILGLNQ